MESSCSWARTDHGSFLHWLEQACGSHGWRVHAWVLMGNQQEAERIIRLTAGHLGLPAAVADLATAGLSGLVAVASTGHKPASRHASTMKNSNFEGLTPEVFGKA